MKDRTGGEDKNGCGAQSVQQSPLAVQLWYGLTSPVGKDHLPLMMANQRDAPRTKTRPEEMI